MRVGWDFQQFFGRDTTLGTTNTLAIDYYRFEYVPYIDFQLYLQNKFLIKNFIDSEITWDMPKFRVNYFLSLIFTDTYKYCPGIGWENEEIGVSITSKTSFMNCYKQLISNFCDRSAAWSGTDAKYLDQCSKSTSVVATVEEYTFKEANVDMTMWKTVAPYSQSFCYDLPLIQSFTNAEGF